MAKFTDENTSGYDADELAELNAAWEETIRFTPTRYDRLEQILLAVFDVGKRGADLPTFPWMTR